LQVEPKDEKAGLSVCDACGDLFEMWDGQVTPEGNICDACIHAISLGLVDDPRYYEENGCRVRITGRWAP
jgi:hypothetical protein